jgi:peptidoglycan hydrolase-like amidase
MKMLLTSPGRPRRLAATAIVALMLVPLACTPSPLGDASSFVVAGSGNGHGVGLSQWGAFGRASSGQNAVQIVAAYYPGAVGTQMAATTMRVHIGSVGSTTLTQMGGTMVASRDGVTPVVAAGPGQTFTLSRMGGVIAVSVDGGAPALLGATGYVNFTQAKPMTVGATGHRYQWGRLVLRATASGGIDRAGASGGIDRAGASGGIDMVLDQMSVDHWVDGLAEVPASWPAAALQAQAVAARTYGRYRLAHPHSPQYDVDELAGDGAYLGYDHEAGRYGGNWLAAVASTANLVLTYGGTPIQAFYSASNGGYSESSGYVFVTALPYLRANPDPLDLNASNPLASWSRSFTSAELAQWLVAAGRPDVGAVVGVDLLGGTGPSGRVDRATFRIRGAAGGSYTLTGNQLRAAIDAKAPAARSLPSTKFTVKGGTQLAA